MLADRRNVRLDDVNLFETRELLEDGPDGENVLVSVRSRDLEDLQHGVHLCDGDGDLHASAGAGHKSSPTDVQLTLTLWRADTGDSRQQQ